MIISFFEEFPTKDNLSKIKLINFKSKIYLATKDIFLFVKLRSGILKKNKKIIDVVWWPVLERKEGYWMSPWSKREAILRIIKQADSNNDFSILWDAELPINKKIFTFPLTPRFYQNRKIIRNFVKNSKNKMFTAEYKSSNMFLDFWLRFSGISFNPKYNHCVIKMVYSSLYGTIDKKDLDKVIKHNKNLYKDRFILSLGIIAKGFGDEGLISPRELRNCLDVAGTNNLKEVVLFRLGGLSREYLDVIYDFCDM